MYVKIIPLTKLPRRMGVFDYGVPEKLKDKIAIGQLVEIPWRTGEKNGLIISIYTEKPEIKTKEILRISDSNPFLYKAQIDLIKWASFYYCVSEASFLNIIIPKIKNTKKTEEQYPVYPEKLKILKSCVAEIQKTLSKIAEHKKTLFHWQDYTNKTAIYIKLLEKFSSNNQVILIFPQLNHIENFLKYLPSALREKTSVLNSEINKTAYWREWNKIRNSEKGIIIGTRQAIFSPVNNLSIIIIDEEHNSSHKQWDQNPRYHTVEVAKKLSGITGAKLVLSSHTPSIETYYSAKKNKYEHIQEAKNNSNNLSINPAVEIIQMQNEWKEDNYSIFCEKAKKLMAKNLMEKKLSIVYLNRRGIGKLTICKDCGYIPKCPNCNLPLSSHTKDVQSSSQQSDKKNDSNTILKCHHCDHSQAPPIPCPKCGGANIRYAGTGTQKIENEIKKIFPNIKIGRLDLDISKKDIKQTLNDLKELDVLIGTTSLLNYNLPRKSELIIFLNIDTDLMIPSAKATETVIQNINNFNFLLELKGTFIIQTYSDDNSTLQCIKNNNFTIYYKEELEKREKMVYPPFSQLIKLTYKHKDSKIVKLEIDKLLDILEKKYCNYNNISILGPISLPMRFKKYAQEIIIKNTATRDGLQEWLISSIGADWIIDVDPIEI